jgi:hypothetical protein
VKYDHNGQQRENQEITKKNVQLEKGSFDE